MNSAVMQLQPTLDTASLEPQATQLPPPVAESTTQALTAPVFTYVTPPVATNESTFSVGTGNSNKFSAGAESGISLGVCVVLLVAGLLIYRFNKWRSNKRAKANQDSTSKPNDANLPTSEPSAQHMSSRQREKMPATNDAVQAAADDEIHPVPPQKVFSALEKGKKADYDSSSLVISPC